MARKEKEILIAELTEELKRSNSFIIADYQGLTAEEMTALRAMMRQVGSEFKVVKNTLASLALKNLNMEGLLSFLDGPTAIAVQKRDIVAGAKALVDFSREHEKLKIKAGFLGGHIVHPSEIESIAKLPSREVLLAQLCRGLTIPITKFCCVLGGLLRELVIVLKAVSEKKTSN